MILRRTFLLAASVLPGCAPAAEPNNFTPVWIVISPADGGYSIQVGTQVVELAELEEAMIDRAVAVNPGISREDARQSVGFYVKAEPGSPSTWIDDLMPVLRRFERVAFVAEDRRR